MANLPTASADSARPEDTTLSQTEVFQKEFIDKWFPKLLQESYFIPPVDTEPEAGENTPIAGQDVYTILSPDSYLPLRHALDDHIAQKRVMDAFYILSNEPAASPAHCEQQTSARGQETVKCSDFHSESLCTAPDFKSSTTPAEGDFDVLVISLKRGILIGCIKLASNRATDVQRVQLEEAITYLDLTEQDVRQLCDRVLVQLAVRKIPRAEIDGLAQIIVKSLEAQQTVQEYRGANVLKGVTEERIEELSDKVFSSRFKIWVSALAEESATKFAQKICANKTKGTCTERVNLKAAADSSHRPGLSNPFTENKHAADEGQISQTGKTKQRSPPKVLSTEDLEILETELAENMSAVVTSLFYQLADTEKVIDQLPGYTADKWKQAIFDKINKFFQDTVCKSVADSLTTADSLRRVACQLFGDNLSSTLDSEVKEAEKLISETVRSQMSKALTERLSGGGNSFSIELLKQTDEEAAYKGTKKLSEQVYDKLKASDLSHLRTSSIPEFSQQVVSILTEKAMCTANLPDTSFRLLTEMGAKLTERAIFRLAGVVSKQLAAKIVRSLFDGMVDKMSDVVRTAAQQLSDSIKERCTDIVKKIKPDVGTTDILNMYILFIYHEVMITSGREEEQRLLNSNNLEWLKGAVGNGGQRTLSGNEITYLALEFLPMLSQQETEGVVDLLFDKWKHSYQDSLATSKGKQFRSELDSACAERLGKRLFAKGYRPVDDINEDVRGLEENNKKADLDLYVNHYVTEVIEILKNISEDFIPDLASRMNIHLTSLFTKELKEYNGQSLSQLAEKVFGWLADKSLAEDLSQGIVKVVKDHEVLDTFPELRIRKTVILPHVTSDILKKQLERNPDLRQRLRKCLQPEETKDPVEVTRLCLCGDMLPPSDYKLPGVPHRTPGDGLDYVCRLQNWWRTRMKENGAQPAMSEELYRGIVTRFCTPVTSVQYYSSAPPRIQLWKQPQNNVQMLGHSQPRRQMWSLGQAVNVVGAMFTRLALYRKQLDILLRGRDLLYLTGPPGTGKTVMLVLKAVQWLREGQHVYVLSTTEESMSAAHQVVSQLRQMAGPDFAKNVHQLHLSRRNPFVWSETANVLREKADRCQGYLNIIADEADSDVLNALTEYLTSGGKVRRLVRLWAAGVYNDKIPQGLTVEKLTDPLRCPPKIVAEIKQTYTMQKLGAVDMYTQPEAAPATAGPDVIFVQHKPKSHECKDVFKCVKCGMEVGEHIQSIVVRTQGDSTLQRRNSLSEQPMTYRDVLIVATKLRHIPLSSGLVDSHGSWSFDPVLDIMAGKTPGLVDGLWKAGVPLWIVDDNEENVAAMAKNTGPEAVTVTEWKHVWGLERKVVVWVEPTDVSEILASKIIAFRSLSRATAQLIRVVTNREE